MRGKFEYELIPGVFATLALNLDMQEKVRQAMEAKGYGKQEIENLIGQCFQEIVTILGLDDGHGI